MASNRRKLPRREATLAENSEKPLKQIVKTEDMCWVQL